MPRWISNASARSGTAQAGTLRSGRPPARPSRATRPARRRVSFRTPSCRRRVSPTFGSPPILRRRTSRRARYGRHAGGPSGALCARLSARTAAARSRPTGAARRARQDRRDGHLGVLRSAPRRRSAIRASCECSRVPGTSSTSTPRATHGGSAATGWSGSSVDSRAERGDEALEPRGPPSAACSAADPTTIPSASSAAAAACAGVEMPNPA